MICTGFGLRPSTGAGALSTTIGCTADEVSIITRPACCRDAVTSTAGAAGAQADVPGTDADRAPEIGEFFVGNGLG